ncbi:MAG: hypothetical protein FWG78_01145 [Coriobacteriia bacterium]|nr:hypothetical protein [Coriobacteriia bacterium]
MAKKTKKKKDAGRNQGIMGIDKEHSRPWVKITVWTLVGGLIFAWLGAGFIYLIGELTGQNVSAEQGQLQQQQFDVDELNATYGGIVASLEASHTTHPNDEDIALQLAQVYASWAQQLYDSRDVSQYPFAIELIEKAIVLAPELEEPGSALIAVMRNAIGN